MASVEQRESNPAIAVVLRGGKPVRIPKTELHEILGVSTIIRVPKRYGKTLATRQPREIVTHFGLPISNQTGQMAAFTVIETPGWFREGVEEVQPVLSIDNIWIARLTLVIPHRNFTELTQDLFVNPIGPKDKQSLRDELLMIYHQSMPDLTDDDILSAVSVRQAQLDHIRT